MSYNIYHISDIKSYLRCPRLFQKTYNKKTSGYNPYLRNDEELSVLAMEKLNINECYKGEKNEDSLVTLSLVGKYEWMVKARFEYLNLRVKIPFLQNVDDGYCLYFLQMNNYPKADDLLYFGLSYLVLKKLNINIKGIKLIHFNAEYVRGESIEPEELFLISDWFYNDSNRKSKPVFDTIKKYRFQMENTLAKMDKALLNEVITKEKTNKCTKRTMCPLYYECFNDEQVLPTNSIMTLVSSQHKNEMYKSGIKYLKDADTSLIEGSKQQYAQIMADRKGGLFYDNLALGMWINQIKNSKLVFIDFEWDTFAIPPFVNMKTFDVICFQYSIHIVDSDNKISHHEYLGYKDCRQEFIESLLNDVPEEGVLVAFNAEGAEKLRLRELSKQYPKYSRQLDDLIERFIDLSKPFGNGLVYDTRMNGNYSLKVIANMIDPSINYQKMDIHYGMDAVYKWRKMDKTNTENQQVIKELLEYCSMDTYAMIVIYDWLKGLV